MSRKRNSLEDDVFAVFERACREQDFEIAEHLLQTLEATAHRSGDHEQLDLAYLSLAHLAPHSRRSR